MNCHDIEPLLLAERDGVLTAEEHAALDRHVAKCAACRKERMLYGEALTFLKTDAANVAVPDVHKEWRAVRAHFHARGRSENKPRSSTLVWLGTSLAAAAALIVVFFISRAKPSGEETPRPSMMAAKPASSNTSTIAYVDKDSGWLVVWATEADAKTSG